jgi:hypothetical protein
MKVRLISVMGMLAAAGLFIAMASGSATTDSGGMPAEMSALQAQVATLQSQVASLQSALATLRANSALELGPYVTVDPNAENGLAGPNIVFHGANVHVESGSGVTVDTTGLGNLVVGYDEDSEADASLASCNTAPILPSERRGSHNLIVGDCHQFTASGGLVTGFSNTISASFANV